LVPYQKVSITAAAFVARDDTVAQKVGEDIAQRRTVAIWHVRPE
jgi:hypothetical protein